MIKSRSSILNVTVEEIDEQQLVQDAKCLFPTSLQQDKNGLHLCNNETNMTLAKETAQENKMEDSEKNKEETTIHEETAETSNGSKEIEESQVEDMSMEVEEKEEEEKRERDDSTDTSLSAQNEHDNVTSNNEVCILLLYSHYSVSVVCTGVM